MVFSAGAAIGEVIVRDDQVRHIAPAAAALSALLSLSAVMTRVSAPFAENPAHALEQTSGSSSITRPPACRSPGSGRAWHDEMLDGALVGRGERDAGGTVTWCLAHVD